MQNIRRMLPFQDRFIKEPRVNEMDSRHTVFVGSVNPTIVTDTNYDAASFKVIQTWFSGIENRSGTLVPLMISLSCRLNLSL